MINEKILKYGDCTITRFDIVGSFFVYLFYNELFKKAKDLMNQSANRSTTDIYKELLCSYSEFTNTSDFFKQAVRGIHNYVVTNTNQIDMTHKECIDFIVSEFVPKSIFGSLRDMHKSKIFHEAMSSVVKQFIAKIISKYMRVVIDNRDANNVVILQNEFIDIICIEKDKVYSKFISGRAAETISVDAYKQKLGAIRDEFEGKFKQLKQDYDSQIEQLLSAIATQKKNNDALETVNKKSADIIKQLQALVKSTEQELAKYKNAPPVRSVRASSPSNSPKNQEQVPVQAQARAQEQEQEDDQDGNNLLFDEADSYY